MFVVSGPAFVGLLAIASVAAQGPDGERRLATVPEPLALVSAPTPTPDGTQTTFRTRAVFGKDGAFVAYCAFRGARPVAVAGERILGEFDYLEDPVLDAERQHYAFRAGERIAKNKERWFAIVDGEPGKAYDWIGIVSLGRGGTAAFWEQPGARLAADGAYHQGSLLFHVGQRVGKKFTDGLSLMPPLWNQEGSRVLTAAQSGRGWCFLLADSRGEKQEKAFAGLVDEVGMSPDGKRFAVAITELAESDPEVDTPPAAGTPDDAHTVMVDGSRIGKGFEGCGMPVFAPTGRRFAYTFRQRGRMGLALDDGRQVRAAYDFVGQPSFSPAGNQILFVTGTGQVGHSAHSGPADEWCQVGTKWSLHRWSLEGDRREVLVRDGDGLAFPTFGPRNLVACAQRSGSGWCMAVGEVCSAEFDQVGPPQFAADGTSVAFGARSGRELWWRTLPLP